MKAIIQHLRFGFSLLILPTYIYALSFVANVNTLNAIFIFIIMHLLVYPSSNAYNSINDKDEGSIGLIEKPLPVPTQLLAVCNIMDLVAVLASFWIHWLIGICVLACVLMSRAYSYRKIRIKKFAITSYIIVSAMQGGFTFLIFYFGSYSSSQIMLELIKDNSNLFLHSLVCTFFIAAIYPLTQIYQHQQDAADGVITISARLGINGTFVLAAVMFLLATVAHITLCILGHDYKSIICFLISTMPSTAYFVSWFIKTTKDKKSANFKNVLIQSLLSCVSLLVYFTYYFINHKI